MPVYPVEFFPPRLGALYPHMSRRDAALWERYLEKFGHLWFGFAYDVAIGGLTIEDPEQTEAEKLGWQYSTAEKIDVVANRGDEHWLIEVRPNARVGAVGGVLAYKLLSDREPWTTLPTVPAVLTDNVSLDVRWFAEQVGVEIILLPDEPRRPL